MGEDGVSLLVFGFDDDVVGFGHGDTELIDTDRFDVLPISRNHRHLQTRNTDIEVGHGCSINETQSNFFARLEDARPVAVRRLAVHEVGVCVATDVGKIRRAHLHLGPHLAVGNSSGPSHLAHVINEVTDGAFVIVVIVRLLLQLCQDPIRILVGPVAQQHHVVTIVAERFGIFRIDHQGTINSGLFLEARMAVVPIGTILVDIKFVLVHAVRSDAMEAQARHTVHVGRQDNAVPVNGRILLQTIANPKGDCVSFPPAQNRPWK